MNLDERSREALDWPLLLRALAEQARTAAGRRAALDLQPLRDRAVALDTLGQVAEWLAAEAEGALPLGALADVRDAVESAARGIVLEGRDLIAIGQTLRGFRALDKALSRLDELAPTLAARVNALPIDDLLGDRLLSAFDSLGRLSGQVFPLLGELRERIESLHREIRATLDRLVAGDEYADVLQDRYYTLRDERYVLPIKVHAKRWDIGVVHGSSGSGRTVYLEPTEVLVLNNRLRGAEAELAEEERRILTALSHEVGAGAPDLRVCLEAGVHLDLIACRAGLARQLDARRPTVGQGGVLRLPGGRHPVLVLRGVSVVPNDLELNPDRPVLVLTGPNAGGKTVALKTLALSALLVQHGCFVPAGEGCRVDWFDTVLAAIGDQQTVEGDLSSFSAHLQTLAEMERRAGPKTLILLDEVASGTDPAQGAALGLALIDGLIDAGSRVVVTTHFAPLKVRGLTDPRYVVAAMQLREGRPTWRATLGATGESHAFAIARRMGLSEGLVARAEGQLDRGERELGALLARLDQERERASTLTEQAQAEVAALADARRSLAEREEALRQAARKLEEQAARAFLDRLAAAEKAVAAVVADLQRQPSPAKVEAARKSLAALKTLAPQAPPKVATFEPQEGDTVRVKGLGQVGVVFKRRGEEVQLRTPTGVQLKARVADLEPAAAQEPKARPRLTNTFERAPVAVPLQRAVRMPGNTCDLRGSRVEEGLEKAEAFFDRALREGRSVVFLLHGHGSGALKDGLRASLRQSAYVADWAPADEEQGGDAFTAVLMA